MLTQLQTCRKWNGRREQHSICGKVIESFLFTQVYVIHSDGDWSSRACESNASMNHCLPRHAGIWFTGVFSFETGWRSVNGRDQGSPVRSNMRLFLLLERINHHSKPATFNLFSFAAMLFESHQRNILDNQCVFWRWICTFPTPPIWHEMRQLVRIHSRETDSLKWAKNNWLKRNIMIRIMTFISQHIIFAIHITFIIHHWMWWTNWDVGTVEIRLLRGILVSGIWSAISCTKFNNWPCYFRALMGSLLTTYRSQEPHGS